ncbi:MAG TPA: HAD-IIB family hydrolase [Syntrophales bacterium]|nr:HAD-IIB family hydrolase [Syntrophales bacterium]HPQ44342.1 HAD-IIB family hydrolase [Syntrophales bacterium]
MLSPITKLRSDVAGKFYGVFFDIDDTFTTGGRIPACAFDALWRLKENGLKVVPITGRPAGWCDHIARMWPVDGVVGENGAFYFWLDEKERKLKKVFLDSPEVRTANRERLWRVGDEILANVPGTAIASDQLYRETDLAVDFCEDVYPLNEEGVEAICRIFRTHGATCKVSSIHVNGWFGRYDKLGMTKRFVRERWGMDLDDTKEHFLFCGDSPNDEPMFRYFPHSAGVGNVLRFADQMKCLPEFVASRDGGEGFTEIMEAVLEGRKSGD